MGIIKMTTSNEPYIPEYCDIEVYLALWVQGYPLYFCEQESKINLDVYDNDKHN